MSFIQVVPLQVILPRSQPVTIEDPTDIYQLDDGVVRGQF